MWRTYTLQSGLEPPPEDNFRNFHSNQNPKKLFTIWPEAPCLRQRSFLQAITTPQENSFSITTARKQTLTQIKGRATERVREEGESGGREENEQEYWDTYLAPLLLEFPFLLARNRTRASLHRYLERRRSRSEAPLLRPLGSPLLLDVAQRQIEFIHFPLLLLPLLLLLLLLLLLTAVSTTKEISQTSNFVSRLQTFCCERASARSRAFRRLFLPPAPAAPKT